MDKAGLCPYFVDGIYQWFRKHQTCRRYVLSWCIYCRQVWDKHTGKGFVYEIIVIIILKKTHFFFLKIEKPRGSLCFLDTCFWEAYLAVRPSRHSHKGRFALQRRPRCDAVRALRQDNEALSALLTNLYFHKYLIISVPLSTQKTVVFGLLPENGGFLRVNTR